MSVLPSTLDKKTEAFEQNRADMLEMLGVLEELHEEAAKGGGEEAMARLATRDKMPIRERVARALDPDTPFLEISSVAAWRSPFAVGSGFVLGIGVIPVAFELTNYYYAVLLGFALLSARRREFGTALCGVAGVSWVIAGTFQWRDEIMTWCSAMVIFYVVWCTARLGWGGGRGRAAPR